VDAAAIALRRMEAVETGTSRVRGTEQAGSAQPLGGAIRRERPRPVEAQPQPRPELRDSERLLQRNGPSDAGREDGRLTSRTAVYGPVCTVVWEGRSREAPPYPDFAAITGTSPGAASPTCERAPEALDAASGALVLDRRIAKPAG